MDSVLLFIDYHDYELFDFLLRRNCFKLNSHTLIRIKVIPLVVVDANDPDAVTDDKNYFKSSQ